MPCFFVKSSLVTLKKCGCFLQVMLNNQWFFSVGVFVLHGDMKSPKLKGDIYLFLKGIYVKFPGCTSPKKSTCTQKKGPFQKEVSSSNH